MGSLRTYREMVARRSSLLCVLAFGRVEGWLNSAALLGERAPAPHRCNLMQMGVVPVTKFDGSESGEAEVSLKVAKSGAYIVHRKVVAEQANMRLGTACTKTRSDVRGGGRKPYQQKGTGRARRGSSRSPLLVGGGVTFGPKPKSYGLKMNKKEKKLAISTALMSALGRMDVVEDLDSHFDMPRTQDMKALLERLSVDTKNDESTLLITKARHENTYLSARNIPYLNLRTLDNINVRDILKAKKVIVASGAMDVIKGRYGEEPSA